MPAIRKLGLGLWSKTRNFIRYWEERFVPLMLAAFLLFFVEVAVFEPLYGWRRFFAIGLTVLVVGEFFHLQNEEMARLKMEIAKFVVSLEEVVDGPAVMGNQNYKGQSSENRGAL